MLGGSAQAPDATVPREGSKRCSRGMPPTPSVPPSLQSGPFHVRDATALGVTSHRLRGRAFKRLLPRVWVWTGHSMSPGDWHDAALLYAPDDARFTGVTRIQRLGLDIGPHFPLQMVVARDLHRDHPAVVIHRTDRMPHSDATDVVPVAAFIEACRWLSVLDAVAVGDWLLRLGHMEPAELVRRCRRDSWREGAAEALWLSPLLDAEALSPQESRVRLNFHAGGLPSPEVNAPIESGGRRVAVADWWWRAYRLVAEYEGGHHQTHRAQYLADIDRYRLFRDLGIDYLQITRELLRNPRTMLRRVDDRLRRAGWDGPPVSTGSRVAALELPVPEAKNAVPGLNAPRLALSPRTTGAGDLRTGHLER